MLPSRPSATGTSHIPSPAEDERAAQGASTGRSAPVGRAAEPPAARRRQQRRLSPTGLFIASSALTAALLISLLAGLSLGAARIPLPDVLAFVDAAVRGGEISAADFTDYTVVWDIRAPRVLLAMIVGAGLSALGVSAQAMVRNPLADPFILGISSGASVGAAAVVTFGVFSFLGIYALSVAAFLGAAGASALVYLLAADRSGFTPVRLILTGVVLAFGFQALMSTIIFFEPRGDAARTVMFWMLGSLGGARWAQLPVVGCLTLAVCVVLRLLAPRLDILSQGDGAAAAMGVDANATRRLLFAITVLGTGALVAVSGAVGFVGLVIPHLTRFLVGPAHGRVLILAPLIGAVFLIWADIASRILFPPRELPLGVVTALIGVPAFLLAMRRHQGRAR